MTEEAFSVTQKIEALGKVAGAFAHDFNNRLTVVTGNLELLERKLADRPDLLIFVHEALAGAAEGAALTRQLLAFSGRQPLYPQPFSASDKINDMKDELRLLLGEGIGLKTTLEPDLWHIAADPGQFETALKNIVANARDASGGKGEVVIASENIEIAQARHAAFGIIAPGKYIRVSVTDTGAGIEEDMMPRVLDPFFSGKAGKNHPGLGLSTAYGFIRQSKGYLDIECGEATCVSLYFPAR